MWCFILYFVFFLQVIGPSEGKIYEFMYIFTFLRRILHRKCTRKLKTKNGAKNRYQVNFFRKKFRNLLIRPYTFIFSVFVLFLLPEKKPKFIVHPLNQGKVCCNCPTSCQRIYLHPYTKHQYGLVQIRIQDENWLLRTLLDQNCILCCSAGLPGTSQGQKLHMPGRLHTMQRTHKYPLWDQGKGACKCLVWLVKVQIRGSKEHQSVND